MVIPSASWMVILNFYDAGGEHLPWYHGQVGALLCRQWGRISVSGAHSGTIGTAKTRSTISDLSQTSILKEDRVFIEKHSKDYLTTSGSLFESLRSLWDHFGVTLGSLWVHFRVTLGSLWGHVGSFGDTFGIVKNEIAK